MDSTVCLFQQVYSLCFRNVFAYFSACFGKAVAEDLSQTAFLKLWKFLKSKNFHEPDNWQAWMFRMSVNLKNDFLRRKRQRGEPTEYDDALINERVETDEMIAFSLTVRRAFDSLPVADREILTLLNIGFSQNEISKLLDLNPSTARSRLMAARRRFRENLNRNGVDCDE